MDFGCVSGRGDDNEVDDDVFEISESKFGKKHQPSAVGHADFFGRHNVAMLTNRRKTSQSVLSRFYDSCSKATKVLYGSSE